MYEGMENSERHPNFQIRFIVDDIKKIFQNRNRTLSCSIYIMLAT